MPKKVLIIEDSEGIRLSLEVAFQAAGATTASAENGEVGLDLAKSIHPDLIILDLFLPEVDGFKVLDALRHDRDTEKTPVVIFSALSQKADKDEALRLGAQDYIVKTEVSIENAVKKALSHVK